MICTLPLSTLLCRSQFVHRLWSVAVICASLSGVFIYLTLLGECDRDSFCVGPRSARPWAAFGFLREPCHIYKVLVRVEVKFVPAQVPQAF